MSTHAKILSIDTATAACSVAIRLDGRIYERYQEGTNVHSKVLLSMVQSVLQDAHLAATDLDAVAVSQGPGSFTGLRIGVGVAQGIAYGVGCPMIGVSSLETLAWQTAQDGLIMAGIDARMGEIYWCQYQVVNGQVEQVGVANVTAPGDIPVTAQMVLVGNAWSEYADLLTQPAQGALNVDLNTRLPRASANVELVNQRFTAGSVVAAADFAPAYVRNDVAKKAQPRN